MVFTPPRQASPRMEFVPAPEALAYGVSGPALCADLSRNSSALVSAALNYSLEFALNKPKACSKLLKPALRRWLNLPSSTRSVEPITRTPRALPLTAAITRTPGALPLITAITRTPRPLPAPPALTAAIPRTPRPLSNHQPFTTNSSLLTCTKGCPQGRLANRRLSASAPPALTAAITRTPRALPNHQPFTTNSSLLTRTKGCPQGRLANRRLSASPPPPPPVNRTKISVFTYISTKNKAFFTPPEEFSCKG
jgi:hypothetical protein